MLTEMNSFNYNNILNVAELLAQRFPFVEISAIAESWCKRDIISFSLGSGEKNVLFLGGMSGNDRITPALLLRFFERLCISYKNDLKISAVRTSNILKNQKITVIPLLNVDGQEISNGGFVKAETFLRLVKRANGIDDYSSWISNARGVEIGKNFNFNFTDSSGYPSPFGYCGPSFESESEIKAVTKFCRKSNIKYSILFSANGEKIVYSPNAKNTDNALMAQIFKSISGFETEERSNDNCKGHFCEWFLKEFNRPSFEFSFNNINPFLLEKFNETYRNYEELLMLSAIM